MFLALSRICQVIEMNNNNHISSPLQEKKILVVHTWGIGDFLLFTPSLKMIRQHFPQAEIHVFVGQTNTKEVIVGNSLVDRVIDFDYKQGSLREKIKFVLTMRNERYDIAIISSGINPFLGGLFLFLIGVPVRVGEYRKRRIFFFTHQIQMDAQIHKMDANINLLSLVGISKKESILPFFEINEEARRFAGDFVKGFLEKDMVLIGFHVSESQPFKTWGMVNFLMLGREIFSHMENVHIIMFAESKKEEQRKKWNEEFGEDISIAAQCSLKQVAALIDECDIFVGSDSGITHLASTTNTHTLAIFGPTDPKRTGPIGKHVHMLRAPCEKPYNDVTTPQYDTSRRHECLDRTTPQQVFNEIRQLTSTSI